MVVIGPDGKVALSTVLTYKVDKYLKEKTTGSYTPSKGGERISIDGHHGKLQAILVKPELQDLYIQQIPWDRQNLLQVHSVRALTLL
jgi:hypothetical protein